MSQIDQPLTPESRDKARSRLRALTRGAVFAATGATVVIGVVVSRDHPGSSSTAKVTGTSGTSSGSGAATTGGSSSTSGSFLVGELRHHGETGTGNTGNSGTSSTMPSVSQSSPTVTSGGSSR